MSTAIAANTVPSKDDIINATVQAVLQPFDLEGSFYKEILLKLKSVAKKSNSKKIQKDIRDNIATSAADMLNIVSSTLINYKPRTLKPKPLKQNETSDPKIKTGTTIESKLTSSFLRDILIRITETHETVGTNLEKISSTVEKLFDISDKNEKKKSMFDTPDANTETNKLLQKIVDLYSNTSNKKDKKDKDQTLEAKFKEGGLVGVLPPNIRLLLGGATLVLGGLAALVNGLQTEGPFKGILKIFSRVGIEGGIQLLIKSAKGFIKGLENIIKAPIEMLKGVKKSIGKIFGVEAFKAVTLAIKSTKGIFGKMFEGLVKFAKPLIKRIPLIGTIISWGFAYTRFKSGDVIGGIIDVLSGIATIFPGVGTAISIGLDVLNAFLDVKAGGADGTANQKKTTILKDWIKGLGDWMHDNARDWPVIGRLIRIGEAIGMGDWASAVTQFTRIIPGTGWLMDFIGSTEEKQIDAYDQIGNIVTGLWSWIKNSLFEKITGMLGKIKDGLTTVWSNLTLEESSWLGSLFGEKPKTPEHKPQQSPSSKEEVPLTDRVPMANGGVVTQPTKALVGEAGPEAVIPLEKISDLAAEKDLETLKQIAKNTKTTNSNMKLLYEAILALAGVIKNQNGKHTSSVFINGQQVSIPSASRVADNNIDAIAQIRRKFAITG